MPKKTALFVLCCFLAVYGSSQTDTSVRVITPHVSPDLRFTENNGQWQDNVLFRAQLDGGAVYIEPNCLTFDFYDKQKYRALHHGGLVNSKYKDLRIQCHAYKVFFEGCNAGAKVEKAQSGTDYENFYIGQDKKKWRSNVKNYHQVWLRNIYDGVDYEVFTAANGIKYNFHVKPGAAVSGIKLRYEGADRLRLKNGALSVELRVNPVTEQRPYAYQVINGKAARVACNYKLTAGKILSFEFPDGYNRNYELVIDPILVFAAQSGSTADNFGMTATFDAAGNLYAGGTAYANGYPVTSGAYDVTFGGNGASLTTDVVITKYNSSGTNLLYSTYVGGSETEVVSSLIVDYNNNLCFYGATGSSNFPVSNTAYDKTFNGGQALGFFLNGTNYPVGTDIYVAKLNSTGTALLGSTFIGGSNNDGVNHVNHTTLINLGGGSFVNEFFIDSLQFNYGDQYRGEIQVDILNNIYIASSTRSSDFPTVSAFDNTLGGKQDAIVSKFDPSLSQLLYSSYLGGSQNECGNSLIVNSAFEAYVTGGTCSNNFPVTPGAHGQNYNGGKADGYIAHISASGNQVLHATYLGTADYDQSYFVQSDKYSQIYVYGQSLGNMPILNTATLTLPYHNSGTHQFISRYNKTLSGRNMSTVFGSNTADTDISPSAFAVDKCNNIYISGWGGNILTNGPPIAGMPLLFPTQSTTDGFDFYFMGLDSNATALKYGSYFGGGLSQEHVDGGTSRFDPRGKIYQSACAGCRGHQDFPVTPGAWPNTPPNPNHSTNCNNGVVKLDFQLQMSISTINTNTLVGCVPVSVTFTNATPSTNPGSTFKWYLGNNVTNTTNLNPSVTYTLPGTYTVSLVVNDNLTCNRKDSSVTYVTVYNKPNTSVSLSYNPCSNTVSLSQSSNGNLGTNPYTWNFGDGSSTSTLSSVTHTYSSNGNYSVTLTVTDIYGCTDVKTNTLSVFDFTTGVARGDTICYGKSVKIKAEGGTSYNWAPAVSLDDHQLASPLATPSLSTIYTVNIINNSPGYTCSKTLTTSLQVDPTPTTNFSFDVNPCGGGVSFKDLSTDEIVSWLWILAPAKTSTLQHPYNFYKTGGTYTVDLTSTNIYSCSSSHQAVLKIDQPDNVEAKGDSIICLNDKAKLKASGGISYQWAPASSLDFPAIAEPVASPTITTEYSVVITTGRVISGKNCEYTLVAPVDVEVLSANPVKATANPQLIVSGDKSTLVYVGDAGATVRWLPPRSTSPETGYTVTAKPTRPTTYTVVASKGPCTETLTVLVESYTEGCLQGDVFIPNTFTPNGDEQNDVLYVNSPKINDLYFAVYNRWGELVFETRDKNKGWDGRYKGREADVGVFGWYLKAKCVNGEETFMKGNVTLIR